MSKLNWVNQLGAGYLCPSIQQEMEDQGLQLREYKIDSGLDYMNDGVEELGLATKQDNSYYQAFHELKEPLDVSTLQSLKISMTVKMDHQYVDCTKIKLELLDWDN